MSLIGPTVSSFANRDPVAPNRTPNQYSEDYSCLYMPIFELAHMKNVHLFEGLGELCLFEQSIYSQQHNDSLNKRSNKVNDHISICSSNIDNK